MKKNSIRWRSTKTGYHWTFQTSPSKD